MAKDRRWRGLSRSIETSESVRRSSLSLTESLVSSCLVAGQRQESSLQARQTCLDC